MAIRTSNVPQRNSVPRPSEGTTRVVRADDLSQALARVRMAYGRDALVLGTRTVTLRDPESMRPRTQVEVTVADPNALPKKAEARAGSALPPWAAAYDSGNGAEPDPTEDEVTEEVADSAAEVEARVHRIDEIAARVKTLASRFETVDGDADHYPLADALRAQGTGEPTLRHLAGSFRLAVRGGEATETAARRHLSKFVRGTRALDVAQMRGEHWFLGRAGSGKTTLVLYLAGTLKQAGVDVAVMAVRPPHAGDVQRLRAAERALGIPVAIANDLDAYVEARASLESSAVVLVDTPCFVGQELPVLPSDDAQRHLVVPLGEDRELLRGHLDSMRGWQADCLAVTQMDLFPRPGRLVDLAVEAGRPVSLLQGRADGQLRVRIARGESLMAAVLGDEGPRIG